MLQEKIQKLLDLGMNTGYELSEYGNMPLSDYLKKSLKRRSLKIPDSLSFLLLKKTLRAFLVSQNIYKEKQIDFFVENLASYPFVQRVDHGELLIDKGTFLNNFFYQIAARENNIPFLLTKQCTRVKCITDRKSLLGAGFVHYRGNVYKIFDKSKSTLDIATLETLGNVKITYDSQNGPSTCMVHPLLQPFVGQTFEQATDAVSKINTRMWDTFNIREKRPLLFINEKFCSDLISSHLGIKESPISAILLQKNIRDSFMETYSDISSNPATLLKKTTDLFWIKDGIALKPLKYSSKDNCLLFTENEKVKERIPFNKDLLSEYLKNGKLYSDIVLSYLSMNVLTGVTAYGGTAQHEYLPAITKLLLDTDRKNKILPKEARTRIEQSQPSSLNFSSLLSVSNEISETLDNMSASFDFNTFEKYIGEKTLLELVGDLSKISYMTNIQLPPKFIQHKKDFYISNSNLQGKERN